MAITVNIYYHGEAGQAKAFANQMIERGIVERTRSQAGNLRYEYFIPLDDQSKVLLIDSWESQAALDIHHDSPMMGEILELREKYNLTMEVERYISDDQSITDKDKQFIS